MKFTLKSLALSTVTVCLTFGVAQNAQAVLITGVTASTNVDTGYGDITNTVNGVGLPGDKPSLTGTHAAASTGNSWLGGFGNIDFNLNGSYKLTGFSFWNMSGPDGWQYYGINGVTVQASTDGTTFTTISGAPTQFAQGTGGSVGPQQYSFSPVTASYVRFTTTSSWGYPTGAAFLEAQFDDETPVPEPLTILGTGVVLGALPVLKKEYAKRKNKKKDGDA